MLKKINLNQIYVISLCIYLCTFMAHRTGIGIDYYLYRGTFVFFIPVNIFRIITIKKIRNYSYFVWIVVFYLFGFLSVTWASSTENVFSNVELFVQVIVLSLFMPQYVRDMKDIEQLIHIYIFAAFYMICVLIIKTPISDWGTIRIGTAVGGHVKDVSMILAFATLFCVYKFLISHKIFFVLLIIIFTMIMLFTGDKKSVLLVTGSIIFLVIIFSKDSMKLIKNILLFSGMLSILIYAIFNVEALYNIIGYRFVGLLNYITGSGNIDGSTRERAFYIQHAKAIFIQKPILGWGLNNYKITLNLINYKNAWYSHCNYWEILTGLGIIGFVLYYSFLFKLEYDALKKRHTKNKFNLWVVSALLVTLIIDYTAVTYYMIYNHIFYIICYLGMKYSLVNENQEQLLTTNRKLLGGYFQL